jgi:ABC-type uncharacterized transport system auxiliary subunit
MIRIRLISSRIGVAAVVLSVANGCAPHRVQYYQLATFERQAVPAETGPVILVGRIVTPQALQDGRIRYREGSNEAGAYEYHRWADPPGIMVKESLIHVLRASGKYKSVQEAGSSAEGDYVVRGKLLDFSELDGTDIQTRVSLDLELREVKTGRLVWTRMLTHAGQVQAKKVSDVVQSLDRNLQMVLDDAASAMGSYVTAHAGTTGN